MDAGIDTGGDSGIIVCECGLRADIIALRVCIVEWVEGHDSLGRHALNFNNELIINRKTRGVLLFFIYLFHFYS